MVKKVKNIYASLMGDSLYRNSVYLMASTAVMAGFGFFFWIINARLFSTEDVGLGTTLISVLTLISSFSLVGLPNGIIRYLPKSERKLEKINTSFTLVTLIALLISVIFVIGQPIFSPKLIFLRNNFVFACLFVFFCVFAALFNLIESVFIAYRATIYVLVKNTVYSLAKLALPFLLISIGAYGIFAASAVAMVAAVLIAFMLLVKRFGFKFQPMLHTGVIENMARFSAGNYVAGFLGSLPALVLPIIITNRIGPHESAYFYMAMMIANFLYVIPIAATQSLFAEGSHNEAEIKNHLKKAIKIITMLLGPTMILILLFGKYVLLAFGKDYSSEGIQLLQLLTISSVFVSINFIGNSLLYLKGKVKLLIGINFVLAVSILGVSYLLISRGLMGVGIAWIIGQGGVAVLYLICLSTLFEDF